MFSRGEEKGGVWQGEGKCVGLYIVKTGKASTTGGQAQLSRFSPEGVRLKNPNSALTVC